MTDGTAKVLFASVDRRLVAGLFLALALELWLFFSDTHFLWNPPRPSFHPLKMAKVLSMSDGAQARSEYDLSWLPLKMNQSLFEGDAVATMANATVTLMLDDGQTVTLGPNSLLVLQKTHLVNPHLFRLTLLQGTLSGALKQELAQDIQIESGGQTLVPIGKTTFNIQASLSHAPVITVNHGQKPAPKPKLSPPQLLRPVIRRNIPTPHSEMNAPKLKHPRIHYPKESSFLRRFLDQPWFISEAYADDAPAVPPSTYTVDLEWEPVPHAKAYVIQIAADPDFAHLQAQKVWTDSHFSWHTNAAGFYYWRVAAVDANGDRGPFSEFMTFTIKTSENAAQDETTYSTYLKFDDYEGNQNRFSIFYGPRIENYFFSGTDPISPPSVVFAKTTITNEQFGYDYRLNPHYSAQLEVQGYRAYVAGGQFQSPTGQPGVGVDETSIYAGAERRFFLPSYYFSLAAGLEMSFVYLPVAGNGTHLTNDFYGFFGPYLLGGIHKTVSWNIDASLKLGGRFQYTGASARIGQIGIVELNKPVTRIVDFGLRLEEDLDSYQMNEGDLIGHGHMLALLPMAFLQVSF